MATRRQRTRPTFIAAARRNHVVETTIESSTTTMPTLPADAVPVTRDDLRRLEQELANLRATVEQVVKDQQVQFTRIAQVQADIDVIRSAWSKVRPETSTPAKAERYVGPERRLSSRKK
jgi:hypothetical protein